MRSLFVTQQFKRDFKKIPKEIQMEANGIVEDLIENPFHPTYNIRKLKLPKVKLYRVRIRVYRLIYSFDKTSLTLHRISHRKDIYKFI